VSSVNRALGILLDHCGQVFVCGAADCHLTRVEAQALIEAGYARRSVYTPTQDNFYLDVTKEGVAHGGRR
jgi:hypothetical protein